MIFFKTCLTLTLTSICGRIWKNDKEELTNMDYQEFLAWLETERGMSIRSSKDVVSRLKRVVNMIGTDEIKKNSAEKLQECEAFNTCSVYIKSQLRRSVNLYFEYLNR